MSLRDIVQRHVDAPGGSSSDGKNDPVRIFGVITVRSPAVVDTVRSREPLRCVVCAGVPPHLDQTRLGRIAKGHRVSLSPWNFGRFTQSYTRWPRGGDGGLRARRCRPVRSMTSSPRWG